MSDPVASPDATAGGCPAAFPGGSHAPLDPDSFSHSLTARERFVAALSEDLKQRRAAGLYRSLTPLGSAAGPTASIDGRELLQFCSNNYLGLAIDPEVIDAARGALGRWGNGSGASRLVAGSMGLHHELEAALAAWKKTEAALVFPTGFMANLAVLTTFAGEADLIVSDKLNHASLIDAARFSGATHRTFVHRSAARARTLLGNRDPATPARSFLVTDSIFSMDGDLADLPALADVADQTSALLVIDEAHATGIFGATGAGLSEAQGVSHRVAIHIGTLSKAIGSIGGFVAGPRVVIDALINTARPFIYTTALPPATSAAALAAIGIIQREPARRERVLSLAVHVKQELTTMGFDCGDSASPIIPIILGSTERATQAAAWLQDQGLYIPAIRPPTVPPSSARLRLSLMATHSDGQIERLLNTMRQLAINIQN